MLIAVRTIASESRSVSRKTAVRVFDRSIEPIETGFESTILQASASTFVQWGVGEAIDIKCETVCAYLKFSLKLFVLTRTVHRSVRN